MRQRDKVRTITKDEYTQLTTCDRCGAEIGRHGYEVFDVEIEAEQGSRYPEGSWTTKMSVDCCKDCWPVVVNALESVGFVFHAYDGQWYDGDGGWPGEQALKRADWDLS